MATMLMVGCSALAARSGCGGTGNPATTAIPQRNREWVQRHLAKVDEAKRRAGTVDLLFVGDSITQNYERTAPFDFRPVWNEFFALHHAMDLGFNADQTQNVLWRLGHGEIDGLAPRDVVLLVGANNLIFSANGRWPQTADQIAAGVLAVAAEIHVHVPGAHLLVLSILPSGLGAEWMHQAHAVNALLQRRIATLPYASWLDVTGLFLDGARVRTELYYDPELSPTMPAVHPLPAGQRLMAQAVAHAVYGK